MAFENRQQNFHSEERIIASLDIGSFKTVVLIAKVYNNNIEIIGLGTVPSNGLKFGAVTNIEKASQSIYEACSEAEIMAGVEISSLITNVTGKHLKGDNSTGVIAINNKQQMVTESDVLRVVGAAQSIRIPGDYEILHVLSKDFKIDDQSGIKDPTGMMGVRLEADVHIVTGHNTQIKNTSIAVEQANFHIQDKVMSSLASSQALLTEGEKELGVAVIDIGADIIDIIVYVEGGVSYSATICIGGNHVTHDIGIGLKTPLEQAETIKKHYGTMLLEEIDPTEMIEIPTISGRPAKNIPRSDLATIIEARMKEVLELIDHELIKSDKKNLLSGGLIFTGGGSLMHGLIELSENIIGLSSSVGYPKGLLGFSDKIESPVFSTAVGLLNYAVKYKNSQSSNKESGKKIFTKIKNWLYNNI